MKHPLIWLFLTVIALAAVSALMLSGSPLPDTPAAPAAGTVESQTRKIPDPTGVMQIRFPAPQSAHDKRSDYPLELLELALRITESEFGPYTIELAHSMSRERQLNELQRGLAINLADTGASQEWADATLPVYFPLRRGLQNFRLLLIHRDQAEEFAKLTSVDQLKALRAGLHTHWLSTTIFKSSGFRVVEGNDYEGLFRMLGHRRFDYFPRGLNEIFTEYDERMAEFPDMIIEPTKALRIPSPTFFHVSPKYPQLHQRLEKGLWLLHASGDLQQLFSRYHDENFYREILKGRKVFNIDNPFLPDHIIYVTPDLWFTP